MRPEFRSTRSSRALPSHNSISKFKWQKLPSRPVSLPPSIAQNSSKDAFDLSWRKQSRHRMTDAQLLKLDALYETDTYPTTEEKRFLGKEIGL
jgi:hypothetical protein